MKKRGIFIGLFSIILVFVLVSTSLSFHIYHQYIGSHIDIFCIKRDKNKSHSSMSLSFFKDIHNLLTYSDEKIYCIFIMKDNDVFTYPVYCFIPGKTRVYRIRLMKGSLVSKLAYLVLNSLNNNNKDILDLLIKEKEFMSELFRKVYNNELSVDIVR